MKITLLTLFVFCSLLLQFSSAAQCGWQAGGARCPNGLCCSKLGWCGNTKPYCKKPDCQSQCKPPTPAPTEDDLSTIITKSQFEEMLMHKDSGCHAVGFYTYEAFITAAKSFPSFGNTGDITLRKKEIAAFFGQTSHETTGGWDGAPDGRYAWGYCYKEEIEQSNVYCSPSSTWPCASGKRYFGRGPMQLSWNYNYGPCGRDIGVDLLNNPDLIATDPIITFKSALWFWMTPQSPKPSAHDVITDQWQPSVTDRAAGRVPGYGVITNIINGGVECGHGEDKYVADRIGFYKRYCKIFGINTGSNLDCYSQRPFGNERPPIPAPTEDDLSSIITKSQFEEMLMHKDSGCHAVGFYTYEAFITAAKSFPSFGNTGDNNLRKKEIAAFFAQTSHETTGGWDGAPDGRYAWGYCYKEEIDQSHVYCSPSSTWPCAPGKKYFGRGPMQLSWNYNYGLCGRDIGADLLKNPDLVATDPVITFKSALWFWMTPQSPKPSAHDVITDQWQPSATDRAAGRVPGYGVITNIINGGVECGHGEDKYVADRIGFYKRYCKIFGVNTGSNLDCYSQRPFGNERPPIPAPTEDDLSSIITKSQFEEMLMHKDNGCHAVGFYTYEAFITAAKSFPSFGNTGDNNLRKKEIAAFFAQTSHETTGGWDGAPDGRYAWGYCYKEEIDQSHVYCSPSSTWPCAPGKKYFGRGPMQLSWNYNYGPCGRNIGADLLNNPDLIATDPVITFKSALWFWMTPQSPKPSAHDVITDQWQPSAADRAAGRVPGYGVITNIINGGVECGHGEDRYVADRIGFYKRYCKIFGVNTGSNLDCYSQRPFGNGLVLDAAL